MDATTGALTLQTSDVSSSISPKSGLRSSISRSSSNQSSGWFSSGCSSFFRSSPLSFGIIYHTPHFWEHATGQNPYPRVAGALSCEARLAKSAVYLEKMQYFLDLAPLLAK